ncbi:MAG: PQQ-binding-like beta-propeller repeat protein [Planctomycetaceae bacterium]
MLRASLACLGFALTLYAIPALAADTWPGFRGDGTSHSAAKQLPQTWEARGRVPGNWTVRLPGYGQSSPIVWKDRVFVTAISGEEKEHAHVVCLDLAEGMVLWQKDFDGTQHVKDSDTVSRGAPTPVIDGDHVYAVFESGDVFALTHAGELKWKRSFVKDYGEIKGPHGFSSSPLLINDLVIIQVAHAGPSYILALDKNTGENRWKVDHPSQTGWSTPASFRHEQTTGIIVSSAGSVRAFRAEDGGLLWEVNEVQGNTTASPTLVGDVVFIGAGGERGPSTRPAPAANVPPSDKPATPPPVPAPGLPGSLAIKLGGSGDVTQSHVVWKSPKVSVGFSSPVFVDGYGYYVNRVGVAQCVDAKTGEVKWTHRLPGACWASPIASEGRIFFFCKDGAVVTLKAGSELVELSESQLSATDVVYGIAAVDGSWIVRTGRGLVRISSSP